MPDNADRTVGFNGLGGIAAKRVLNVGSGPYDPTRLHPAFRNRGWTEVRYDIDERLKPDIVGSIVNLEAVKSASFDAIWCAHNLEHLHAHDVPKALVEFRRVLKPDGFALITAPDLEAIAELVCSGRLEEVAYRSLAGPVTALDMLYGLSIAIERGNQFMCHNTGFTTERLGRLLVESSFAEVLVKRGSSYELWALALMVEANKQDLLAYLRANSLDLFPDD
jgi:SAM-dependent methyltransferase